MERKKNEKEIRKMNKRNNINSVSSNNSGFDNLSDNKYKHSSRR